MNCEDLRTEELPTAFQRAFDAPPQQVMHSPGRVDLIGEHTDYDDGFTLPVALDLGTDVAVGRRPDGLLRTVARELDATDTRPIDALRPTEGRSGPAESPRPRRSCARAPAPCPTPAAGASSPALGGQ